MMARSRRSAGPGDAKPDGSGWLNRAGYGWLVILGPMFCYLALLISLDIMGLASDREVYYNRLDPDLEFKQGLELDLFSIAGRSEFALTSAVYFLVALFSVLWAAPQIIRRWRNPFGGVRGLLIAVGASAVLYWLYWVSSYNLRIAFSNQVLEIAEGAGALTMLNMRIVVFGIDLVGQDLTPAELLARVHGFVYFFGNAAPWFLIVFAACSASFEPGSFGKEKRQSLRERMANLQLAVVLAAANIVLSVAYLRAMMSWPTHLLIDDVSRDFMLATARYAAIWGAIGTLMLISALAPAYLSLTRHFDRVAVYEREQEGDIYVSYQEKRAWRQEHGLVLSSQEILATGAAVIAPLLTGPTLEAGAEREEGAPVIVQERAVDQF